MPDDLPIASTADDSSGVKPERRKTESQTRKKGPESEVRGGPEAIPDKPLEQLRRDERR